MKSEVGYFISFAVGTVLGAGAAWFLTKQKYEAHAEEEIAEVREAYRKKYEPEEEKEPEEDRQEHTVPQTSSIPSYLANKSANKPEITSYRNIIRNEGYSAKPSEDVEDDTIAIVSPMDFGDDPDYEKITLTLTANGYLLDEDLDPVEDEYSLIGMGVNEIRDHFGEYEDDSVYVVNHDRQAYYEILDSMREYES